MCFRSLFDRLSFAASCHFSLGKLLYYTELCFESSPSGLNNIEELPMTNEQLRISAPSLCNPHCIVFVCYLAVIIELRLIVTGFTVYWNGCSALGKY
jgi:hypothetical protein